MYHRLLPDRGSGPDACVAAVTVGGKLYGIVGMIFFIPICSVLYTLLKENVRYRLRKKKNLAVVKEEEINA